MRQGKWWLALAIASLPLLLSWTYGLFDLDEGFYAAITGEMNRRGEWITPFYNGNPWFEKPILLYWFAKPSVMLFGDVIGPRLPSVLATIAMYVVVAGAVRKWCGERAGLWTLAMFGGCLMSGAIGQLMLTDPLYVLALSAAFLLFFASLQGRPGLRGWVGLLLGFSVLGKGPVGIVFFALLAAWTFFAEPELRPHFRGGWAWASVGLMAAMATWYLPAALIHGGDFIRSFFIEQNIGRFLGGDEAHRVPLWSHPIYYAVVLLALGAPWTWLGFAYRAKGSETHSSNPESQFRRYISRWFWIVFGLFTIAGTKLPHYIYPALVPVVMLAAIGWSKRERTESQIARFGLGAAIVVTGVMFGVSQWAYSATGQREAHALIEKAKEAAGPEGTIAVYQMSRLNKADRGTGRAKLQETSLPSLVFYAGRVLVDTDDMQKVLSSPLPVYLITRWNRIDEAELAAIRAKGFQVEELTGVNEQPNFRLFRISR